MTSLKPSTAPLAQLPETPEGYEVVSQQPLPKYFNLFRGHPKLFLYPIACAVAIPCSLIGTDDSGRIKAPAASMTAAIVFGSMLTARGASDRIIHRQQFRFMGDPSVEAAAAESGVDAATIAQRLSVFTGHQRQNWMGMLTNDTRIVINLREPGANNVFARKLPAGERSFAILRRVS